MGVLASLLSLAVTLVLGVWAASLLDFLTVEHRRVWRQATTDLRERSRFMPAVAFVSAWVFTWVIAVAIRADIAVLLLTFALPLLLIGEFLVDGAALAVALPMVALAPLLGDDTVDAESEFALPVTRVHESNAPDVSTWWSRNIPIPKGRSTAVIGASGSGKTTTVKHLVRQLNPRSGDPVVIFEAKDDYRKELSGHGVEPLVVSADADAATVAWNLFREISPENVEGDIKELARDIMPEPSGENEHFERIERQLFRDICWMFYEHRESPSNKELIEYLRTTPRADVAEHLKETGFHTTGDYITGDGSGNEDSYFSGMVSVVDEVLTQGFALEGDFSVREYFESPAAFGAPLVFDYDFRAKSASNVYAHLLDTAITHALESDGGVDGRRSFLILDEIEQLDAELEYLETALNLGRGEGVVSILTMQTVAQLEGTYGESEATSILAGCHSVVMMDSNDKETTDFYRSRLGQRREVKTGHVERAESPFGGTTVTNRETRVEDVDEFSTQSLSSMVAGEAIVVRGSGREYVHAQIANTE